VPQISNGKSATRLSRRRVDELPRNALSKVDRNMLQTMAAGTDKAAKSKLRPRSRNHPTSGQPGASLGIDRPSYTKAYGGHHPP
jgi:hypothetical protein